MMLHWLAIKLKKNKKKKEEKCETLTLLPIIFYLIFQSCFWPHFYNSYMPLFLFFTVFFLVNLVLLLVVWLVACSFFFFYMYNEEKQSFVEHCCSASDLWVNFNILDICRQLIKYLICYFIILFPNFYFCN